MAPEDPGAGTAPLGAMLPVILTLTTVTPEAPDEAPPVPGTSNANTTTGH
jgi:hypothetical protein